MGDETSTPTTPMTETPRIRMGLIGCGGRAEGHARAAKLSQRCELVACCDVDGDRSRDFAAEWGLENHYTDVATMLAEAGVDLVSVVTPAAVRFTLLDALLDSGVPAVLMEKPLETRPEEGYLILDRFRASSSQLFVNHQLRYFEPLQQFRDLISSGAIGRVRMLRATTRYSILEHGTHIFDLVNFLMEDSLVPERLLVQASGWEQVGSMPECPTHTAGVMTTAEGPRIYFECGPWAPSWPGTINAWHQAGIDIVGSSGVAGWSLNRGWWIVGEGGRDEMRWEHDALDDVAQAALLDDIAVNIAPDAVHTSALIDSTRSAWSFQVVMAAMRSASERSWVDGLGQVSDEDVDRLHDQLSEPLPESFLPALAAPQPVAPETPAAADAPEDAEGVREPALEHTSGLTPNRSEAELREAAG